VAGSWPGVTHAYSARDTVSRACSAPTSAVTSFLRAGRRSHYETCCGLQRGERLGAQGDPHVEVSTHTPESVAHPRSAASGPGPELACTRWRRHRRIDPGRLRIRRTRERTVRHPPVSWWLSHRLSAAVTLVSSDTTRMSAGLMLEHGLAVPTRGSLGNRGCHGDCSSVFADRRPLRKQPVL
jgi:hypothetical protein